MPIMGEINKNRIFRINPEYKKNKAAIKSQIRSDIWFWIDQPMEVMPVPESRITLHLAEVKVTWKEYTNIL
jgi:hypothetical protein